MNMPAIDSGGGHVRLRLDIAYDGTDFAGWAAQAGQRTVAGVLDEALSTVFRTPVIVRAAGRTDTGVHATGQVAHVDIPADALAHAYPASAATRPNRNSCRWCADWRSSCRPMSGCARSSAPQPDSTPGSRRLRRHYVYRLSTAPYGVEPQPGPVRRRRGRSPSTSMRWPRRRGSCWVCNDFAAFCRHRDGATTIRDLQRLDWVRDGRRRSPPTSPPMRSAGTWSDHWSARCWRWGRAARPAGLGHRATRIAHRGPVISPLPRPAA